jgi:hypothetical protein
MSTPKYIQEEKNMKNICVILLMTMIVGCNVSPLSPRINNKNNGSIQELKNNQNGLMLDLIEIEQKQKLIMEKLETLQQGFINQNNKNFGIQIFHGEGGLLVGAGILGILIFSIFYYKKSSKENEKSARLLADQIKSQNNKDLINEVYLSALNTGVEKKIYELLN